MTTPTNSAAAIQAATRLASPILRSNPARSLSAWLSKTSGSVTA
jgi:hypothetical protein